MSVLLFSDQVFASWQATGGVGQVSGNKLTLSVQAGQTYVVGVAGGTTIGKYTVDLRLAAAPGGSDGASGGGGGPAGPVNPARCLALELVEGALARAKGLVSTLPATD